MPGPPDSLIISSKFRTPEIYAKHMGTRTHFISLAPDVYVLIKQIPIVRSRLNESSLWPQSDFFSEMLINKQAPCDAGFHTPNYKQR